jgi:hypothetical protein
MEGVQPDSELTYPARVAVRQISEPAQSFRLGSSLRVEAEAEGQDLARAAALGADWSHWMVEPAKAAAALEVHS